MSDSVAFAILVASQIIVSASISLGSLRWKPSIDWRWRLPFATLALPSLGVALLGWMMFGMGHLTDLAVMAIAAVIIVTGALVPVGLIASLAALKLVHWRAKE